MEWVGRVQATYIHIIKHIPSGNQTWQWANPPCVADFPTFFCLDFYFRDFSIATFHYRRTCTYIHYIALHCIALHCIALHCLTLHYIALHCLTLLYIHTLHTYTYIYIYMRCTFGWWDDGIRTLLLEAINTHKKSWMQALRFFHILPNIHVVQTIRSSFSRKFANTLCKFEYQVATTWTRLNIHMQ